MSYVPKYIIRRLLPQKGIKLVGNVLEFMFVNVITPISIVEDFPEDLSGKIKVTIDGKEVSEEQIFNTELLIEGNTYKVSEIGKLKGQTIPIGSEIIIKVPDGDKLVESGKSYKISVWVEDSPGLSMDIERMVN